MENQVMKAIRNIALLATCAMASMAQPCVAADRMRAGQWEGTWTGAGMTRPTSNCMTQGEVDAVNGDAKTVRAYLETIIPTEICKVADLHVNGSQIIYTSICTGAKENVITTTYHGDSFESVDSSGAKSVARRTGPCK
jgi:hypothetical protein